jgi:hypothetical protein
LEYQPLVELTSNRVVAVEDRTLIGGDACRSPADAEHGLTRNDDGSSTGTPLSASFRIPTICVSLNFDFRMTVPCRSSPPATVQ